MGGSSSKPPTNQTTEVDQKTDYGTNVARINFDMRETKETKLMDSFLMLHESTLVGVVVGMLVMMTIALTLYAFGKCWCARIHQVCGGSSGSNSEEVDMAEQGKGPARVSMME